MGTLDKRLATLEKTAQQTDIVTFIILVGLGDAGKELTHIWDGHGNHWHRLPDETEGALKHRATSESPRNGNRTLMLLGEHSAAVGTESLP